MLRGQRGKVARRLNEVMMRRARQEHKCMTLEIYYFDFHFAAAVPVLAM